jgi:hypothetical protein
MVAAYCATMANDDSAKDAALALAGVAAATLGASGSLAAAAGGVLGVAFERFGSRDTRRAARIVERLISTDETPEDFANYLRGRLLNDDDAVIGTFRSLLTAALDAVSPAALEAMAQLARRHLRGLAPVWLARGGLRTFAEATDAELGALRQFLPMVAAYPARRSAIFEAAGRHYVGMDQIKTVGLYVAEGRTWEVRVADPRAEIGPAPEHHRRIFRLLKLHGLADPVTDPPTKTRDTDCIAIEVAVANELATAASVG